MTSLSPKKKPMRTMVSTMSIREPSPGVFSSASFCASRALSYRSHTRRYVTATKVDVRYLFTDPREIVGRAFNASEISDSPFVFSASAKRCQAVAARLRWLSP